MNRKEEYEDRALGLDGKEPSARDRWMSFYRLWRAAKNRNGPFSEGQAQLAFYALGYASWVRLVMAVDHSCSSVEVKGNEVPEFLRRRFLDHRRRHRLYDGYGSHRWEYMERDQKVAATLRRQQGIEILPEEVAAVRWKMLTHLKRRMAERGGWPPPPDHELWSETMDLYVKKGGYLYD